MRMRRTTTTIRGLVFCARTTSHPVSQAVELSRPNFISGIRNRKIHRLANSQQPPPSPEETSVLCTTNTHTNTHRDTSTGMYPELNTTTAKLCRTKRCWGQRMRRIRSVGWLAGRMTRCGGSRLVFWAAIVGFDFRCHRMRKESYGP